MIIGGSLYLIQLVDLYSGSGSMTLYIKLILVMIYIGLFKVLFKNTQKNIENLKMMVEGEENIPRTFVPSLKLKIK